MNIQLKQAFEAEMAMAYSHFKKGNLNTAFRHLERAHVLGQRNIVPHVRSHWLMLRIGLAHRSPIKVWAQSMRIILGALGSALNIVPAGNTGGTDISMFARKSIAPDLAKIINGQ
jgi:hypothetical protein